MIETNDPIIFTYCFRHLLQPHKSQPKSQSGSVHRYDKVRDGSSEPTPPYKMLRRSDESPVSRPGDGTVGGHGRAKTTHTLGGKNGMPRGSVVFKNSSTLICSSILIFK